MQTQTISSTQAASDRETFSNQTLLLTALTAINNPSSHPSLNDSEVNKERIRTMKAKAARTRIIDAVTTILVTDTEILATMTRRTHTTNSIFALTEIRQKDKAQHERFESKLENLAPEGSHQMLPGDFDMEDRGPVTDEDVFISIPNMNKKIHVQESTERFCRPTDRGDWPQRCTRRRCRSIDEACQLHGESGAGARNGRDGADWEGPQRYSPSGGCAVRSRTQNRRKDIAV